MVTHPKPMDLIVLFNTESMILRLVKYGTVDHLDPAQAKDTKGTQHSGPRRDDRAHHITKEKT